MKKYLIMLIVMVVLFAMPVLASTPEEENAPMASEDELFWGEMGQLSEEEMILINGNVITSDSITHDTDACTNEMMKEREKERMNLYNSLEIAKLKSKISQKFNIPASILSALLSAIGAAINWAISQGANSPGQIIEYIYIGIAIANPALIASISTAALVGIVTYIVINALE